MLKKELVEELVQRFPQFSKKDMDLLVGAFLMPLKKASRQEG